MAGEFGIAGDGCGVLELSTPFNTLNQKIAVYFRHHIKEERMYAITIQPGKRGWAIKAGCHRFYWGEGEFKDMMSEIVDYLQDPDKYTEKKVANLARAYPNECPPEFPGDGTLDEAPPEFERGMEEL